MKVDQPAASTQDCTSSSFLSSKDLQMQCPLSDGEHRFRKMSLKWQHLCANFHWPGNLVLCEIGNATQSTGDKGAARCLFSVSETGEYFQLRHNSDVGRGLSRSRPLPGTISVARSTARGHPPDPPAKAPKPGRMGRGSASCRALCRTDRARGESPATLVRGHGGNAAVPVRTGVRGQGLASRHLKGACNGARKEGTLFRSVKE